MMVWIGMVLVRRFGKSVCHWFAHRFKWNRGKVETWRARNGTYMVGFRCDCGKLLGIHPAQMERHPRRVF